jgi:UDP-2,3-diacylglucosamine pyrophosphatase LpxH
VLAHRWLAFLGDWAYRTLMQLNVVVNARVAPMGLEYWSLSKHAKHKVKGAVSVISRFEEAVAHEARTQGVDGVVCGHIHTAEIRDFDGITYYNDGDWVEGCNALVEHMDGTMELLHWPEEIKKRANAGADMMVAA